MYYVVDRALKDGRQEFEINAASGNGAPNVIMTIPVSRVPSWQIVNPALSPDGKWLAMPLTDGFTTNIWAISTGDRRMKRVTDFGARPIYIARRVSWSSDGRSILAAVGEGDADVVLLDGLVRGGRMVTRAALPLAHLFELDGATIIRCSGEPGERQVAPARGRRAWRREPGRYDAGSRKVRGRGRKITVVNRSRPQPARSACTFPCRRA